MTTRFRDELEKMPRERQERIRRRTEELLAFLEVLERVPSAEPLEGDELPEELREEE